jgi:PAS domain S-box-containing protein
MIKRLRRRRVRPDADPALYRRIIDAALDHAIFTIDPDGYITSWSPGAETVFGWSADEIIGQPFDATFTEEDRANDIPTKERIVARTDGVAPNVRWHMRKDGSLVFIDGTTRAVFDESGRLDSFVKVGQDVTERRRADDELRESEAGLRTLTDTLEARVAERTAALSDSNRALLAEIRDREVAEDARTELLRLLVTAEENERGRISRELHDHMGQQLTGLLLGLRVLEQDERDPARLSRIRALADLASSIAGDLHEVAAVLRPPALDNLGLERALRSHLEEWSQQHGVIADFHAEGVQLDALTSEMATTLYRIAQEGLTNIARHAVAKSVSLVLEQHEGTVSLILEDDGVGFDVESTETIDSRRHLGLRGMRERLALVGGELEIESGPSAGTSLFARVPLAAERA